ncbi:MAG: cytochrome c family protein [Pseudomonadota bacterium]
MSVTSFLIVILGVFAAQAASADEGAELFESCAICHGVEPGEAGIGPHLHGIVGRAVGIVEGYRYSEGMQDYADSGAVWSTAELDGFIANPRAHVKGTKMSFAGLDDPAERATLIAYLETLK